MSSSNFIPSNANNNSDPLTGLLAAVTGGCVKFDRSLGAIARPLLPERAPRPADTISQGPELHNDDDLNDDAGRGLEAQ